MGLKTTKAENAILSILYHAHTLNNRCDMTADEITTRLTKMRDQQHMLWTLKLMSDSGLVERTDYGWQITVRGEQHWERLCSGISRFNNS